MFYILFSAVCVRHICRCACHCLCAVCASICVTSCCLFSLYATSSCFRVTLLTASSHHFRVHTHFSQNVIFVPCLSGAITQPFVANASSVLCDPTSNSSGNFVAAHITNNWNPQKLPSSNSIRLSKRRIMPCPSSTCNRRVHSRCSPSISRTLQLPIHTWIQFCPKLQQMLGRCPKMLVYAILDMALTCMTSFRIW